MCSIICTPCLRVYNYEYEPTVEAVEWHRLVITIWARTIKVDQFPVILGRFHSLSFSFVSLSLLSLFLSLLLPFSLPFSSSNVYKYFPRSYLSFLKLENIYLYIAVPTCRIHIMCFGGTTDDHNSSAVESGYEIAPITERATSLMYVKIFNR